MASFVIGFIATENKDVFGIVDMAANTLTAYLTAKYKGENWVERMMRFGSVHAEICMNLRSVVLEFMDDGQQRRMFMHFSCDSDHQEVYAGSKVIFTLGTHGNAEEIISLVGEALKIYGPCYYNTCSLTDNWIQL